MRISRFTKVIASAIAVVVFIAASFFALPKGKVHSQSDLSRFFVYFPLYLESGIYLWPVEYLRPPTESPAKDAIEALIAGLPLDLVESCGIMVVSLPQKTQVLSLDVEKGLCTLDFSKDVEKVSVGSGGEAALIAAITETLFQFPDIDGVKILVGGEEVESLAGHVSIDQPFSKIKAKSHKFMTFPDASNHWGGGVISSLQVRDVVAGYPDNTFKPDRNLTRVEFLKMLVETARLPYVEKEAVPFEDVSHDWYRPYLERALAAGIVVAGDYGTRFVPDGEISREEACHLLIKCSEIYLEDHSELESDPLEDAPEFSDMASVQQRYLDSVRRCIKLGFIKGYPDGTFQPKDTLTRAEACAILTRMMGIKGDRILLSEPQSGFVWKGSDVFTLGFAIAHEANINWRVVTPSGAHVIEENYTTSSHGMAWGAFGLCLDRRLLTADGPMNLELYMIDMRDGSEYSLMSVPLKP